MKIMAAIFGFSMLPFAAFATAPVTVPNPVSCSSVLSRQMSTSLTNDTSAQAFLDGIPPCGARKVNTSSRDVEAWRFNDLVYVRTPLVLMSPAYVAHTLDVSGINVYTLAVSPLLLVSQDGRSVFKTVNIR